MEGSVTQWIPIGVAAIINQLIYKMEGSVTQWIPIGVAAIVILSLLWYLFQRYRWWRDVISKNPVITTLKPVLTVRMVQENPRIEDQIKSVKVNAPRANFRQYLKYLQLACLPYLWSVPFKVAQEYWYRLFESKLTEEQKRERLGSMIMETSLILLIHDKPSSDIYRFVCKDFMLPTNDPKDDKYHHFKDCQILVKVVGKVKPSLVSITVDGEEIKSIDAMFGFLNTLWCVYTHTLTHIQAGNIAEVNLFDMKDRDDLSSDFKHSIDDMHSAVSGMNESANHYPADIWGIPRKNLQYILGYNGTQQIHNHQNILLCIKISKFVDFTMKARLVYGKHLAKTGISISTLSANTIFHSIDHYNMGKYMLHERKEKSYLGIDSRMITTLLGKLNYDFGRWQAMKYTKYATWREIYLELKEIDSYLADKIHMFVSV